MKSAIQIILNLFEFETDAVIFHNISVCILNKVFPVAQLVEHGVSNAKIMGSIPRESKS